MQVEVIVNSASALKNVNWRFGMLHPYAVVWIDTSRKCSTKIDVNNGMNPIWNEKFTIPLPPTSFPETAMLYIDIVHANAPVGTKPVVGSARLPLSQAIDQARTHGVVALCMNLTRPSGRPQGVVGIKIGVKDPNVGQVNQYNQQPAPFKQQIPAQPVHQVPPQANFQPRPQVQLQGQLQPRPQFQPQLQGLYPPQQQPQVQLQGQFQSRQQIQPQGQNLYQPQPQVQPQGQVQPRPVVQQRGQYQPQQVVQPQIQYQHQPKAQAHGQYPPQQHPKPQQQQIPVPQVQPMKKHPNNKLQQQVPVQAQQMKKNPNKLAPVNTPNLKGPVKPAQGPRNFMPAAANRPASRPINLVQNEQPYNPVFGMGPGANGTGKSRAMPIAQNKNLQQSANNPNNNNAAPGAAGVNDNGQTNSDPNANNTIDNSNTEQLDQTNSIETFNDAESIQLSYDEAQCTSVETDNGGYDLCEYATAEEYGSTGGNMTVGLECDNGGYYANASVEGGYDENAGVGCDNGGYDANAGVECVNGGYDANAGVECDSRGYDANSDVGYAYGGYDMNAGTDYDYGGYDANAGVEYDNGIYENGDCVDGAELNNYADCGEVDVSCEN